MDSNTFITLEAVTVRLGGNWLLNGLSWRINTGEHWVIWGPNGTGKSILARVLLDQVAVVQGHVRRCYRENAGDYPHRPAMALVSPEQYHYYYDREQIGLLFVSHHSDEIPSCVDRRLFLEAGRVVRVS